MNTQPNEEMNKNLCIEKSIEDLDALVAPASMVEIFGLEGVGEGSRRNKRAI